MRHRRGRPEPYQEKPQDATIVADVVDAGVVQTRSPNFAFVTAGFDAFMVMTTRSVTVSEENAGRVDVVVRHLSEASHSQVRGLIDQNCVTINGKPCTDGGTEVVESDVVAIRFDPTQRYKEKKRKWSDRTFKVAYEDRHLIVVDKAAGTLTVPTNKAEDNTLVDRVSVYISHSARNREAFVVHRLPRDVSGLLIFGKHEPIALSLIEQFKEEKPERVYVALVAGVISNDDGTLRSPVFEEQKSGRATTRSPGDDDIAVTHYKVLRRLADTTLVQLKLETSKRDQLRIQCSDAGHPVLGDPRYKPQRANHPKWKRRTMALHAKTLTFAHPVSGERMTVESALPPAMQKFAKAARKP